MTPTCTGRRPAPARPEDHIVVLTDERGRLAGPPARPLRPWDRALASWHAFTLDGQLAAGVSPDRDRLIAARAQALVRPAYRRKLARDWDRLVRTACARPSASVRLPLRRDRIAAAEPEIRRLQDVLSSGLPVPARGVAMARCLLTDASGPVYSRRSPAGLSALLGEAIRHMDPWLALVPDQPQSREAPESSA
jgi:hypothetical protein